MTPHRYCHGPCGSDIGAIRAVAVLLNTVSSPHGSQNSHGYTLSRRARRRAVLHVCYSRVQERQACKSVVERYHNLCDEYHAVVSSLQGGSQLVLSIRIDQVLFLPR